jgi:hypothetical protein
MLDQEAREGFAQHGGDIEDGKGPHRQHQKNAENDQYLLAPRDHGSTLPF